MPSPTTPPIPPLFLERMARFLGVEFDDFANAMQQTPVSGLRVNTLKLSPEQFERISPFDLGEKIPWCDSAFILPPPSFSPGLHPYHLAGLYYLQDPSAMSPAELLMSVPPTSDMRVLDLAAAPGGKTTHLAALMRGEGLLVANEIKDKRVGHLAQNVERWGAGNIVVTNETPERLADHFGPFFDRVLVDAPCSGEGMFRKDMGARVDWSPEMVTGCATRQGNILRVAAKLVKPGGYLLYSTCTFAPEEDEGVIRELLGEFEVVELPLFEGFMRGKPEWLPDTPNAASLSGAVRLFPHRLRGEGHFACLLQKISTDYLTDERIKSTDWERVNGWGSTNAGTDKRMSRKNPFSSAHPLDNLLTFWQEFASATLHADLPEERLRLSGERLYLVPPEMPDFGRLRQVHRGVWLGTFKKERFEPAHPLALYLKPGQAANSLDLSPGSRELTGYLRGETLESQGQPGWVLITADGWPIGWGKRVQGVVKNHFPRGWM